jgi:hypothetical protein
MPFEFSIMNEQLLVVACHSSCLVPPLPGHVVPLRRLHRQSNQAYLSNVLKQSRPARPMSRLCRQFEVAAWWQNKISVATITTVLLLVVRT